MNEQASSQNQSTASIAVTPTPTSTSHWQWTGVSCLLLLVYLTFFHLCLGASYSMCIVIGLVSWLVWSLICLSVKSVFLSRFEYLIHQLVGIDLLLEGFNPLHQGYGFYYCAASFWAVFLVYRFLLATRLEHCAIGHGEKLAAGGPVGIVVNG